MSEPAKKMSGIALVEHLLTKPYTGLVSISRESVLFSTRRIGITPKALKDLHRETGREPRIIPQKGGDTIYFDLTNEGRNEE